MRIQYSWTQLNDSRIYNINIDGHSLHVTVTAHETAFERWQHTVLNDDTNLSNLASYRFVVGIGVGSRFHQTTGFNVAETLTLCIGNRCLIFQMRYCEAMPIDLIDFLLEPSCTFVGFWTQYFRSFLYYSPHHLLELHMDPLDMLSFFHHQLARGSVDRIMRTFLRLREQHIGFYLSDWSLATLTDDQVLRASIESYCAFAMGVNIQAWLYRQPGSLPGPSDDDADCYSAPSTSNDTQ